MFRQWLALVIIVLVYIPAAIDATVLHVVVPASSVTLGTSGNELLWIIDIYSLVMVGMVLPVGALGDRIGLKRLPLLGGGLFGLAPLAAIFVHSASWLVAARAALAIGAAMIVPATLAGIRATSFEQRHRNMAFGVWATVGSGGAAFGPLVGGMLLEHSYWGSVFLINVSIVLVMMDLIAHLVPHQAGCCNQSLNFGHAIVLTIATLLLVYSAKTVLKGRTATVVITSVLLTSALLLWQFVRIQLAATRPMIDMHLFTHRTILNGVVIAITAMITPVGFELLMAQELQFIHGLAPHQAGLLMLPIMLANGFSGLVAGILISRLKLCCVTTAGAVLSAISFYGLAMTDFSSQQIQTWILMTLLGLSAINAPLASAATIMTVVPTEKTATAGVIEAMVYELGAGLRIAISGLLLSRNFSASILSPTGLNPQKVEHAMSSMGEVVQLMYSLPSSLSEALLTAAGEVSI